MLARFLRQVFHEVSKPVFKQGNFRTDIPTTLRNKGIRTWVLGKAKHFTKLLILLK